jgi:hypothetical protein
MAWAWLNLKANCRTCIMEVTTYTNRSLTLTIAISRGLLVDKKNQIKHNFLMMKIHSPRMHLNSAIRQVEGLR